MDLVASEFTRVFRSNSNYSQTRHEFALDGRDFDSVFRFRLCVARDVALQRFRIASSGRTLLVLEEHELAPCHHDAEWDESVREIDVWQTTLGGCPAKPHTSPLRNPSVLHNVALRNDVVGILNAGRERLQVDMSFSRPVDRLSLFATGAIHRSAAAPVADDQDQAGFRREHGYIPLGGVRGSRMVSLSSMFPAHVREVWIHWPSEQMLCSAGEGIASISSVCNHTETFTDAPRGFVATDENTAVVRVDKTLRHTDRYDLVVYFSPFFEAGCEKRKRRACGKANEVAVRGVCILRRWFQKTMSCPRGRLQRHIESRIMFLVRQQVFFDLMNNLPESVQITTVTQQ